MRRYQIEIPAELESLRIAAPFTDAVLRELPDLPERDRLIHDLALVSSEALTNAIRHGDTSARPVRLAYSIDSGGLTISVTDHGPGFDPEAVSLPDFDGYPEGGYGIYIIKTIMDGLRYDRSPDGNILTLTRSWKGP